MQMNTLRESRVPDDVKWIFHPALHGISSAATNPPPYLTDITCYVSCRFSSRRNRLPLRSLRRKLEVMSPPKFLNHVTNKLKSSERSYLMTQKSFREKSFLASWPHKETQNLSCSKMAQAGLYRTGGYDGVRCPFCKESWDSWNVDDEPMAAHSRAVDDCPFVVLERANRECTPDDHDRVQCVFCRGSLHKWESEDNPMADHAKLFPFCRFVKGLECGNKEYKNDLLLADELKPITLLTMPEMKKNRDGSVSTNSGAFGISTNKAAVIKFAPYETRKNTYGRRPATNVLRPEPLCEKDVCDKGEPEQIRESGKQDAPNECGKDEEYEEKPYSSKPLSNDEMNDLKQISAPKVQQTPTNSRQRANDNSDLGSLPGTSHANRKRSLNDESQSTKFDVKAKIGPDQLLGSRTTAEAGEITSADNPVSSSQERLERLLRRDSRDGKLELLKKVGNCGQTILHEVVQRGDIEMLKCLLLSVSPQERRMLLELKAMFGRTVLHCAVYVGNAEVMRCLRELVSETDWYHLLEQPDVQNNLPLDEADKNIHRAKFAELINEWRDNRHRYLSVPQVWPQTEPVHTLPEESQQQSTSMTVPRYRLVDAPPAVVPPPNIPIVQAVQETGQNYYADSDRYSPVEYDM